jgi:uncharacterized damage-inducible protein DinB
MLANLRRLLLHAEWADLRITEALKTADAPPTEAVREMSHVLGAAEVWLARLEYRPSRTPVWPVLTTAGIDQLAPEVHGGYTRYIAPLQEGDLGQLVQYTNSAGGAFATPVADILLHVALHGQYHRGKINLLLRQAGLPPAPTDYVAFVRGVPAATAQSHTMESR